MPLFVYYKANNTLGYGCAVQYQPNVDGHGNCYNKNIFQTHDVTEREAMMGLNYLREKYKVRVRVRAILCHCLHTYPLECLACKIRKMAGKIRGTL